MQQQQMEQRKRRLLVISQHFWPENFRISDIVEGFVENGIEVDVLCGLPNYPKGEWFEGYRYRGPRRQQYAGAELFRAGEIRRKGNTSLRIFLNYCSFPLFALFNLPRLAGRRYDAVLCYETSPVMMLLPAIVYAKLHRLPLTGYVLDLWPDNLYSVMPIQSTLLRGIAQRVSRWHYRRCNKLAALSHTQAALLQQMTQGTKHPPSIHIIPQYSEDFYAQTIDDTELKQRFSGQFNILFAGNISPAQDLETLVRAMKIVRQNPNGQDVNVLILGDGMSRSQLEEYICSQGMQQAFCFCGSVPATDIPRWTGVADALFAALSKSENLGMTVPAKIASYMAAARPILCATGGEGEMAVAESGGGLVSPPGDENALAENILRLKTLPPAERTSIGAKGQQYYRRHYHRATLLKELEEFIFSS